MKLSGNLKVFMKNWLKKTVTNKNFINFFIFLKITFFVILFSWISFFPEPVQRHYVMCTRIFLGLFFFASFFKEGNSKNFLDLQDWPLWVFLACLSAGLVSAQDKKIAWETYSTLAFNLFFLFYIAKALLLEEKNKVWITWVISILSSLVAGIGILELHFGKNILYENFIRNPYYLKYTTGFARPMSTQFDATVLGGFLLGCLPFSFILFKKTTFCSKLFGAVGIVLNTVVIILTFSRGVFLGLIVIIALYLLVEKRYNLAIIFLIITFTSSAAFSYLPYPLSKLGIGGIITDKLFSRSKLNRAGLKPITEEHSLDKSYDFEEFGRNWIYEDSVVSNYRLVRLNMALRILRDHPFAGLGFQHFRIRFYEYYPHKQRIPSDIMIADNMYLTILAETGIIGFLGFFVFVFSLVKKGWKRCRLLNYKSDKRNMLLVSLMAFIGLLINMAGYELFYWSNQYVLFCAIAGFIHACLNNPKSKVNAA